MQPGLKCVPLGYAQIADLSAVEGLPAVGSPAAVPEGANVITVLIAEVAGVRWRDDGVNPDANTGMLLSIGTEFVYTGTMANLKAIAAGAGAKLNVSYYRVVG